MRRQGASIFIYLIFGLLIAIFVININPGQKGGGGGCGTASNSAVSVAGSKVNRTSYRIAYGSLNGGGRQREHLALDILIRRELLALAAGDHGIRVDGDLVDDAIKKGYFFVHFPPSPRDPAAMSPSGRINLGQTVFDVHEDGSKTWNFKKWKQFVTGMDVTLGSFRDEQQRAMQATLMAELGMASVR